MPSPVQKPVALQQMGEQHDRKNYKKYEDKGEEIIMKKRSFTLLMSALTISATLIGTSPVAAKTDTDTATEETTDKEETTAKDADSENTDNKETMHPRVIH